MPAMSRPGRAGGGVTGNAVANPVEDADDLPPCDRARVPSQESRELPPQRLRSLRRRHDAMRGLILFVIVDQRAQRRLGLRRQRRASRPPLGGGIAALLCREHRLSRQQAGVGQRQRADGPKREPLGAACVAVIL